MSQAGVQQELFSVSPGSPINPWDDGGLNEPFQAMHVVHDSEGFYPASRHEAFLALYLLDKQFSERAHGAAMYMHILRLRQTSVGDPTPQSTLVREAESMGEFYSDSRWGLLALTGLAETVADTPNPRLRLDDEEFAAHGEGRKALVRYLDLRKIVSSEGKTGLDFDPLETSYRLGDWNQLFVEHVEDIAAELTVKDLRLLLPESMGSEGTRGDAWARRIREIQAYPYLKASVRHGLLALVRAELDE